MNIPLEGLKKTINRITASTKPTASQARKTIAKRKTKHNENLKRLPRKTKTVIIQKQKKKEGQNN